MSSLHPLRPVAAELLTLCRSATTGAENAREGLSSQYSSSFLTASIRPRAQTLSKSCTSRNSAPTSPSPRSVHLCTTRRGTLLALPALPRLDS